MKVFAWPARANRETNPYNYRLYETIAANDVEVYEFKLRTFTKSFLLARSGDILHIHWPESIFATSSLVKAFVRLITTIVGLNLLKIKGVKIVWTAHNTYSHENRYPFLESLLWSSMRYLVDGVISLSQEGACQALEMHRLVNKSIAIIPHGDYKLDYINHIDKDQARIKLNVPETSKVLLFFGMIKDYKNVLDLIKEFKLLDGDFVLLIAGKCDDIKLRDLIVREAAEDRRIILNMSYVVPEDVQYYFNASDLTILPFKKILNSGSAILSLSFDRPVLVPALGSMIELKNIVGSEWVITYDKFDIDTIKIALLAAENMRIKSISQTSLSWETIGQQTLEFYKHVRST